MKTKCQQKLQILCIFIWWNEWSLSLPVPTSFAEWLEINSFSKIYNLKLPFEIRIELLGAGDDAVHFVLKYYLYKYTVYSQHPWYGDVNAGMVWAST